MSRTTPRKVDKTPSQDVGSNPFSRTRSQERRIVHKLLKEGINLSKEKSIMGSSTTEAQGGEGLYHDKCKPKMSSTREKATEKKRLSVYVLYREKFIE